MPAPLYAIGLGPGNPACLTQQARDALGSVQCIIGYKKYMAMLPPEYKKEKILVANGMKEERQRCNTAIDYALAGKPTAVVCSGDAGIYAMASPLLELMESRGVVESLPFAVIPGISALSAAAAALGAPIGHDFACISLSDLLTPIECIKKRVKLALEADFVLVLFNPRSQGRPDHLAQIMKLAREKRAPDCPVGLVRNASLPNQKILLTNLDQFDPTAADMLSVVILGNSTSRQVGEFMLTPRGYWPANCRP